MSGEYLEYLWALTKNPNLINILSTRQLGTLLDRTDWDWCIRIKGMIGLFSIHEIDEEYYEYLAEYEDIFVVNDKSTRKEYKRLMNELRNLFGLPAKK